MAVTRGDDGSPDRLQGTLFDDSEVPGVSGGPSAPQKAGASGQRRADSDDIGYRGPTACSAAGITYRQLGLLGAHRPGRAERPRRPRVRPQRLYSFRDILVLKVVKRLLDTGISLQQIRAAVQHLRDRGSADLAQVTLMSDGVERLRECTSDRRGGRPAARRPGRVRHRARQGLARGRGRPGRDARRPGRGRLVAVPPGGAGFQDDLARRRLRRTSRDGLAATSHHLGRARVRSQMPTTPAGRVSPRNRGAPKGQHPRNLSGTRTGRDRHSLERRPSLSGRRDRRGSQRPRSSGRALHDRLRRSSHRPDTSRAAAHAQQPGLFLAR